MSKTKLTPAETKMITFPCLRCMARAGQWCMTSGGHSAGLLHAERYYAWKAVEARSKK